MRVMSANSISVALVCDFFFPAVGGAEVHLYQLSSHMALRGHRVVVITHAVGSERMGVRYLESGVKVYYVAQLPFYNNTSFPTLFSTLPMVREILQRERVQIVHGHSAFSVLAHESILHAKAMGIATCFTDHSLFGFQDASAILTNKLLQASLCGTQVICVSNTCKQNTILRAHVDPCNVRVIPNAIDARKFVPDISQRDPAFVTVAFCARLELRKGADLLAEIIAPLCQLVPNLRFLIAGDGRKRALIEEVRDLHQLGDRVVLLGSIPHTQVPSILVRADLFLNTSLTEAFCMAILEAASCGCYVVSTNVGGIPEVLPDSMITLAEPNAQALMDAIVKAIPKLPTVNPQQFHEEIASMYDWQDVADETLELYQSTVDRPPSILFMLNEYQKRCGTVFGKVFALIFLMDCVFLWILQWIKPHVEEARKWGPPPGSRLE